MERSRIDPKLYRLTLTIGIMLAFSTLLACNSSNKQQSFGTVTPPVINAFGNPPITITTAAETATTIPMTEIMTVTAVPTASVYYTDTPTPTYPPPAGAGTKEAFDTAVARNLDAMRTEIALTHAPTETPGDPPLYPTVTPIMGLINACAGTSSSGPQCVNAWRGIINGDSIEIRAGNEGIDGDESQGLLEVGVRGHPPEDIYNTPQKVGSVRVVAVDGARVTLATIDLRTPVALLTPWATTTPGTIFYFDLITRQWLDPNGTPIPSPTLTPTP